MLNDKDLNRRQFLTRVASVGAAASPMFFGGRIAYSQTPGAPKTVIVGGPGLLGPGDCRYVGTFRLPYGWDYGPNGMAYNAANNSLFIGARYNPYTVGEIAIPTTLGTGSDYTSLPRAAVLQNYVEPTEGLYLKLDGDTNRRQGGLAIVNGKLCVSWCTWYGTRGLRSHLLRPLNLSTTGQVDGWYQVGDSITGLNNNGWTGGSGMCPIPSEWQSALGGDLLVGSSAMSTISDGCSLGPGAFSVQSSAFVGGADKHVQAKTMLCYTMTNLGPTGLAADGTVSAHWNINSNAYGTVFPGGSTRTVLFIGRYGSGGLHYGQGTTDISLDGTLVPGTNGAEYYWYDPANTDKGYHSWPYHLKAWAYDANDLAAVVVGKKRYYDLLPCAEWTFAPPPWMPQRSTSSVTGSMQHLFSCYGLGFDPLSRRLYMQISGYGYEGQNCVMVYQLPA